MDEMAEDYRKDSAAEQAFRRTARELDGLIANHGGRLGLRGSQAVFAAVVVLRDAADHIVAVWD